MDNIDSLLVPQQLGREEIQRWFEQHMPPAVYQEACNLEDLEQWVLDGDPSRGFGVALESLAQFMMPKEGRAGVLFAEEDVPDLVRVLAYARTTAAMRLLGMAGQSQPGFGGDILQLCSQISQPGNPLEAESKVMLSRVRFLARVDCYRRVFGPERRQEILKILESFTQESAQ